MRAPPEASPRIRQGGPEKIVKIVTKNLEAHIVLSIALEIVGIVVKNIRLLLKDTP